MSTILKEIVDVLGNASPVVFAVLSGASVLITVGSWSSVRRLHKSISEGERLRLMANARVLSTVGEYLGNQSDNDVQKVATDHQHVM